MIGLALVTTMSILGSSAKDSVDRTIEENFFGDLVVSNVIGVPFSPAIADRIEDTEGVEAVSRLRYANATFDGGGGQGVMGVDPDALAQVARVPMVEGSLADLRDGTALVSDERARDESLAVGDEVEMAFPTGSRSLEVVGIYEPDNAVLFFPFTTTLDTLTEAGFPEADNYLMVNVAPGADPASVQRTLEEQTAELPTITVKDQAGFAEEQRAPIDQLLLLIYALLGLALVIAVLGIVNTLALSVIERTREVGLLRAIGLGRAQLRRMIRLEAIVIAVLGAVLGVGMGAGVRPRAADLARRRRPRRAGPCPGGSWPATCSGPGSSGCWPRSSRRDGPPGSTCWRRSRPSSTGTSGTSPSADPRPRRARSWLRWSHRGRAEVRWPTWRLQGDHARPCTSTCRSGSTSGA